MDTVTPAWSFLCLFPFLVGAGAVIVAIVVVSKKTSHTHRGGRPAGTLPPIVLPAVFWLVLLFGGAMLFIGMLLLLTSVNGPRQEAGLWVTVLVLMGVGGFVVWYALPRLYPQWRKIREERLRARKTLPPDGSPMPDLKTTLFSKMGVAALVVGAAVGGLVFLLTWHTFLSVVIGAVFAFAVLKMQTSQLRVVTRMTAEDGRVKTEVPLRFTPAVPRPSGKGPLIPLMILVVIACVTMGFCLIQLRSDGGNFDWRKGLVPLGAAVVIDIVMAGIMAVGWKKGWFRRWTPAAPVAIQTPQSPVLTPDIPQSRGDCPTCGHTIPSDSPHGLCPRCLIRGAMPSPTSTRLRRGVSPIEPPTPAEVNEFFPHLEVLDLVGAGGMGAVYTVRQPTLDRIVALKIVQSPRGDEDPVFAERFAREARAMAKLDHPNIVTIHESGEAGGLPYLVMEYIDGVTLREAMANRLLTTVEALAVIPQVCDALDYAHRAGVVHRDIKPENILIDQTGRVKIADFGLAKLADPKNVTLTRTQQAMGTPHYMAPEQWERPNEVDHRADVYALGVVLYELLTGELPLGRFALPSEKGKGDVKLDQVVIRALAKDPGERYQNAGQMKAALSGVKLSAFNPVVMPKKRKGFEYRSKTSFLGMPLVHVVAGWDPVTGKKRIAKGWIAVGDVAAFGGIAVSGVSSFGVVGIGGVTGIGLFGIGGAAAVGVLALGGNAFGLLAAMGGNAASFGLAFGGLAAGKFAIGGQAAGEYVLSDKVKTPGFGDALLSWLRGFWPW